MTAIDETYDRLKKINEPKGYFFGDNPVLTMELIDGLLVNKERYGYMCCPCRLAGGRVCDLGHPGRPGVEEAPDDARLPARTTL